MSCAYPEHLIKLAGNSINKQIGKNQNQWQPIISLLLPLSQEGFIWIGRKMVEKAANGDAWGAKIILNYMIMARYTVGIAYVIGSYATTATSWVLIGYEFCKDLKLCLKVVLMKIRNRGTVQDQASRLESLALNEIVEFHAPFSCFFVVLVAYYSPNGHLYGNIKNSYWQYEEIENIEHTLLGMGIFFVLDFSSGVICSLILWFSCKINVWAVFLALEKEYILGFCLILGRDTTVVSNILR